MKRGIILVGLLCWTLAPRERLPGHGVLGRVVQHHILATVGASHLDLTVEVTFHSVFAQRERRRLDANGDGLIQAGESRLYLEEIQGGLETGLRMTAAKREAHLTPLHSPELDLMGNEAAGGHPLRVRAYYVARLDGRLRRTGLADLENRLWPEAPALCTLEVRGLERAISTGRRVTSFFGPGSTRRFSLELFPRASSAHRQVNPWRPDEIRSEAGPRR